MVVPFPTAVTFPFPSTVAIPVLSLFHVISLFTFAVDGVIVACNVSDTFVLKSNARLSFIDIPVGLVWTVTVTDWCINPLELFTFIFTTPFPTPVTKPFWSTVATLSFSLLHVTPSVVPIEGFLVASNCTVSPTSITADAGDTVIPIILVSTITLHDASKPFSVLTVTIVLPFSNPVTSAFTSLSSCKSLFLFVTVTIFGSSADQDKFLNTFAVDGVIIASNSAVLFLSLLLFTTTSFFFNAIPVGLVCTVTLQVAIFSFPVFTVIVAVPFPTAYTFPFSSTFATSASLVDHVKFKNTFAVLGFIVAFNLNNFESVLKSITFSVVSNVTDFGAVWTFTVDVLVINESLPVACIVTVPCATPVTTPSELIVATLSAPSSGFSSIIFQPILSFDDSGYFSACNWYSSPISIACSCGTIFIPVIVAPTITLHCAEHPFLVVAVIIATPDSSPPITSASALFSFASFGTTFANDSLDVFHVISISLFAVGGFIVAINCNAESFVVSIVALDLLRLIEIGVVSTVTIHVAVNPFTVVAVTLVSPLLIPVTYPYSSTFAIDVSPLFQSTVLSTPLSFGVILAVNWIVFLFVLKSIVNSLCDNVIPFGFVFTSISHFASIPSTLAITVVFPFFNPNTLITLFSDVVSILTIVSSVVLHDTLDVLLVLSLISCLSPFSNDFIADGINLA